MKTIFLNTLSGPGNGETIQKIAEITRELGGEWLISKFIVLDGGFTGIVRGSIAAEQQVRLTEALQQQVPGLHIGELPLPAEDRSTKQRITLDIDSLDRPGLTKDISAFFESRSLTIERMESTRHPIGSISSTLYSTTVSLIGAPDCDPEELVRNIEAMGPSISVTLHAGHA